MITVGFKEGSKGLGLGLGLGFGYEGEMREGEIWNPDITFSNLDERLKKALGAFRKYFKGGIASGNLGPIYGDYGSFLSIYRRPQGGRGCVREGFYPQGGRKKSKVVDMDPSSVNASAKDQPKYDVHPSKGRKCESSKSSIISVPRSQNGTVTHSLPLVRGSQNENGRNSLSADGFMGDNSFKTLKQDMNLSANQSIAAATDALKEVIKHKDHADCIEESGSNSEGIREGKIWNPDVSFLNLDERLENVLGTFRKHFKGGISSGNLGPINGDYGSFLPVYQQPQGSRVLEGFSDRMKTKKRSLSLTDGDFNSVCKKSKVDEMDPLSVSSSAADRYKCDIHPSKSRKCESSKSSKSSVSGSQNGTVTHSLPSVHGSQNENGTNSLLTDGFMSDNSLKTLNQGMNLSEKQHANQSIAAATVALKEAFKLMDYADRIQKSGSNSEGMSLSFEAALKYLHAASLLESCHGQSERTLQSMQTYRRAAELCASCAHEYEKSKDMAAASLAYKCMEVAYMRIISSSHAGARKDRHELQRDLKIVPPGEYLSSSICDVNNLGSPSTLDKVVAVQNRPIVRLLNFTGDVNSAMEASTKSRIAFASASRRVEDPRFREGVTLVQKALDFSFQDVERLLWLVRQALEAISCKIFSAWDCTL